MMLQNEAPTKTSWLGGFLRVTVGFKKHPSFSIYRTRAIIGRSRFEAALVYKPRILGLKNEEFPFLVHKLSVI